MLGAADSAAALRNACLPNQAHPLRETYGDEALSRLHMGGFGAIWI